MAEAADSELVARALAYPFGSPPGSYELVAGEVRPLRCVPPSDGLAVLAYGANASPEALVRKLGSRAAAARVVVSSARLHGFDVAYSAHVSPYGSIPGALMRAPGTTIALHVLRCDEADRDLLHRTEPNYQWAVLADLELRLDDGGTVSEAGAFVTRHGLLRVGGGPLAMAAVEAVARTIPQADEATVLACARDRLAPGAELDDFVLEQIIDPGVASRRTDRLRADAIDPDLRFTG